MSNTSISSPRLPITEDSLFCKDGCFKLFCLKLCRFKSWYRRQHEPDQSMKDQRSSQQEAPIVTQNSVNLFLSASIRVSLWKCLESKLSGSQMKELVIAVDSLNRMIPDGLLWSVPADLPWFKKTTRCTALLTGRKTWHRIKHPLAGRRVVLLSHKQRGEKI